MIVASADDWLSNHLNAGIVIFEDWGGELAGAVTEGHQIEQTGYFLT